MASSTESSSSAPDKYDQYLKERLAQTVSQVKWIELLSFFLMLSVFLLGALFVLCLIDAWVVELNVWMRWAALTILASGAIGFSIYKALPFLLWRINPRYAAKKLEEGRPELKNSVINYLTTADEKGGNIDPSVLRKLSQSAARDVANIPLDVTVDRSSMILAGYVLAGVVALFALYKVVSPKDPFQTIGRVILPSASLMAPARVKISDIDPGDEQKYFGDAVQISAKIRGLKEGEFPQLLYTSDSGTQKSQPLPMLREGDSDRFIIAMGQKDGLRESFAYQIQAGDATSVEYRIDVRTCPTVFLEKVEYTPPAYTGISPRTEKNPSTVSGVEGAIAKLWVRTNLPIETGYLKLFNVVPAKNENLGDGESEQASDNNQQSKIEAVQWSVAKSIKIEVVNETEAFVELPLVLNGKRTQARYSHFQIVFTSTDGSKSENETMKRIEVIRDLNPEIEVVAPAEKVVEIPLDRSERIEFAAVDPDHGLTAVTLVAEQKGNRLLEKVVFRSPTPIGIKGNQVGGFEFRPKDFGLSVGDEIVWYGLAEDNRTLGPEQALVPNRARTENYKFVISAPLKNPSDSRNDPESTKNKDPENQPPENKQNPDQDPKSKKEDEKQGTKDDPANNQNQNNDQKQQPGGAENKDPKKGKGDQSGKSQPQKDQNQKGKSDPQKDAKSQEQPGKGSGKQKESESGKSPKDDNQKEKSSGKGKASDGKQNGSSQKSSDPKSGKSDPKSAKEKQPSESKSGKSGKGKDSRDPSKGQAGNEKQNSKTGSGDPANEKLANDPDSRSADENLNDNSKGEPQGKPQNSKEAFERLKKYFDKKNQEDSKGSENQNPKPDPNSSDPDKANDPGKKSGNENGKEDPSSTKPDPSLNKSKNDPGGKKTADQNPKKGNESQSGDDAKKKMGDDPGSQKTPSKSGDEKKGEKKSGKPGAKKQDSTAKEKAGDPKKGTGQPGSDKNKQGDQSKQNGSKNNPNKSSQEKNPQGKGNKNNPQGEKSGNKKSGKSDTDAKGQKSDDPRNQKGSNDPKGQGQESKKKSGSEREKNSDGKRNVDDRQPQKDSGGNTGNVNQSSTKESQDAGSRQKSSQAGKSRPETKADKANLDYTKKTTDMVLEKLADQKSQSDQELLKDLNWTQEELREFTRKWQAMKDKADGGSVRDQKRFEDALKSLGLRDPDLSRGAAGLSNDDRTGYRQKSGTRNVPSDFARKFRAIQKSQRKLGSQE